jgi:hypothetical protein
LQKFISPWSQAAGKEKGILVITKMQILRHLSKMKSIKHGNTVILPISMIGLHISKVKQNRKPLIRKTPLPPKETRGITI